MSGCNGVKNWDDFDQDSVRDGSDCAPDDSSIYPGATETTGDGIDSNCDGVECSTEDQITWYYVDEDLDGYYTLLTGQPAVCPDGYLTSDATFEDINNDGVINEADLDVDDSDPDVNVEKLWYADNDGDGYGDETDAGTYAYSAEEAESNYDVTNATADHTDWDDTDANVYPGAPEICDGKDNDGNGETDETFEFAETTVNADTDSDGYGDPTGATDKVCEATAGYVNNSNDCDDTDAAINPDATELCDGVDNDCDTLVDSEDDSVNMEGAAWYFDADGDGFADTNALTDTSGALYIEQCDNPGANWIASSDITDVNGDGTVNEDDFDADDTDATVKPNNVWYADTDGDGFGDASTSSIGNYAPSGYVADNTDWDDTDANMNPETVFYTDADGDGFGDFADAGTTFDYDPRPDGGVSTENSDLDDEDGSSYPGAAKILDGRDTNQDGISDEWEDSEADITLTAEDPTGFGYAMTTPDLNGDGDLDFVISDRNNAQIYVTYGPITASSTVSASGYGTGSGSSDSNGFIIADSSLTRLGQATRAADVDGDGLDDLLLGAPYADTGESNAGNAYVIFGPFAENGEVTALSNLVSDHVGCTLSGTSANQNLGASTIPLGDLNSDGYDDVAINSAENAYLFSGDTSCPGGLSSALTFAAADSSYVVTSLTAAGDINGDGDTDILVSAPSHNSDTGIAYLITGASGSYDTDVEAASTTITGTSTGDQLVARITAPGGCDINADGYDDIVTAASYADSSSGTLNVGALYLMWGAATGYGTVSANDSEVQIFGVIENDRFSNGTALCISDPRGSGNDGILASAFYTDSDGETDVGSTYAFTDLQDATGTHTVEAAGDAIRGSTSDAQLTLKDFNDINGDGDPDIGTGSVTNGTVNFFGFQNL